MKDYNKIRGIRLSEKTWEQFQHLKEDGVSWEVFIKDLLLTLHEYEQNNTR
jgi:hypothetical protein